MNIDKVTIVEKNFLTNIQWKIRKVTSIQHKMYKFSFKFLFKIKLLKIIFI